MQNENHTELQVDYKNIKKEKDIEEYHTVKKKRKKKRKIRLAVKILVILLLFIAYLISDFSNVKKIIVKNANILSNEEVISLSKINHQSKSIFINNLFKTKMNHVLVKDYHIKNNYLGEIILDIEEVKVVGYIIEEKSIDLLTDTNEKISHEYVPDYIMRLPKINTVEDDFLKLLSVQLGKLDATLIARISEITKVVRSYDNKTVLLIMEDGNKVYGSIDDLILLKNYNDIIQTVKGNNHCIQLDSANNSAYKFTCPTS